MPKEHTIPTGAQRCELTDLDIEDCIVCGASQGFWWEARGRGVVHVKLVCEVGHYIKFLPRSRVGLGTWVEE